MEATPEKQLFELISKANRKYGHVIKTKRVLVGSSEACDITLRGSGVSAIHAVIEIKDNNKFKIYDMNAAGGTFVNGEKIVAADFKIGDTLQLGRSEFEFKKYSNRDLPPALDMLDPTIAPKVPSRRNLVKSRPRPTRSTQPPEKPRLPQSPPPESLNAGVELERQAREQQQPPSRNLPKDLPLEEEYHESIPEVVEEIAYPLAKDPKAEFSEYIFEDVDSLYPIFKYKINEAAVEIIIIHKDRIYSVDYLPAKDGTYKLSGKEAKKNEVEYAYLGKEEKVDFVEVQNGEVLIHSLHDYDFMCLGDDSKGMSNSGIYLLRDDDIVRFHKGDLQVFVRKTDSPPDVRPAPIMRRDKDFWKWMAIVFLFAFLFMVGITTYEVDHELDKENIPDRIATILYQKELVVSKEQAVEKTPDKPEEIVQKSPVQEVEPEPEPTPTPEPQPEPEPSPEPAVAEQGTPDVADRGEVRQARPQPGPPTQQDQVRPSERQEQASQAAPQDQSAHESAIEADTSGHVDTYQSADFSANMNRLMARGGRTRDADARRNVPSSRPGMGTVSSADSARVERAQVSQDVGSLTGTARGQLDDTRGAQGLVERTEMFTAGTPFREVVLGGMDPDAIRRILIEHIPQFRHCYQQELDRAAQAVQGVVRLDFIIGASGHVTRAGVESAAANLPTGVQSCVVNVLRGIRFPAPRGGGVVEVSQPMNFYPRAN